jgi:serine/threonine-protein kinase
MGAVYLAARDDDEFKKRVAIKLLRGGMESDDLLRRFKNERQILAAIEHPHIARLIDGGQTEDGKPYFAMEYVEGVPIDKYCDRRRLGIPERLQLFCKVATAVHFAHQNLVVHRDVKPGNILVTGDGEPKLLDFGIAKILNPELSVSTIAPTQFEMRLMTPEYSSPEQVLGETITTASDVYSLGVLLYELLAGRRPYEIKSYNLTEIARVITEEDPPRPSTVVSREEMAGLGELPATSTPETVSRNRGTSTERLRRTLSGDLDNIVLKAMRKEPQRRYDSAQQLAEDIERYLKGLPVLARKDTLGYRSAKFVRRHRTPLAAALVVLLSLMGFTAFTMRERARAEREALKARAVTEFLQETLGAANPVEGVAHDVTVVEALETAVLKLESSFAREPEIEAAVRNTLGRTYWRLGEHERAASVLAPTVLEGERRLGKTHPELAASLYLMGEVRGYQGDFRASEEFLLRALSIQESTLGMIHPDTARTLNTLGVLMHYTGRYDEGEPFFRRALELRREIYGERHLEIVESLNDLGFLLEENGRFDDAERLYREALRMSEGLVGREHPATAEVMAHLAWLAEEKGDYRAAEAMLREVLDVEIRMKGADHPEVGTAMNDLALVLHDEGRLEEAEEYQREVLARFRRYYGDGHPEVATTAQNLARTLWLSGDEEEAEALFREALEIRRKALGNKHADVATTLVFLSRLLCASESRLEALSLFEEAIAVFEGALGPAHWRLANARSHYGECLTSAGQYAEAESQLRAALAVFEPEEERFQEYLSATREAVDRLEALRGGAKGR